jgi:hypothetical protein
MDKARGVLRFKALRKLPTTTCSALQPAWYLYGYRDVFNTFCEQKARGMTLCEEGFLGLLQKFHRFVWQDGEVLVGNYQCSCAEVDF